MTGVAGAVIQQYAAVVIRSDGLVYPAGNDTFADGYLTVGVSTAAALVGEDVDVVIDGPMATGAAWALGPLYLGDGGVLVSSLPSVADALFALQVAVATTVTTLFVRPQFPVALV